MWERLTPNPFVAELLAQTVKVIFIVFGLILALSLIGAETILGTLLGGAGVIGIAVGFAVKDTIENYIASLMLSIRQPFRARDHIVINQQEGIVVRLTSRATILMTLDGNQLRIPNAEVFKGTILNYTKILSAVLPLSWAWMPITIRWPLSKSALTPSMIWLLC